MIFRQSLIPFKYNTQPQNGVTGVVRLVTLEYALLDWRYGEPL